MDALLLEKRRFRRMLEVEVDGEAHFVEYLGDGPGYEAVLLDGVEVERKHGILKMVPEFEFDLNGHTVRLEIEAGMGLNLLGPLWLGQLQRFALKVDDQLLYEDRHGREVTDEVAI